MGVNEDGFYRRGFVKEKDFSEGLYVRYMLHITSIRKK
jgi:hypothetical protein